MPGALLAELSWLCLLEQGRVGGRGRGKPGTHTEAAEAAGGKSVREPLPHARRHAESLSSTLSGPAQRYYPHSAQETRVLFVPGHHLVSGKAGTKPRPHGFLLSP